MRRSMANTKIVTDEGISSDNCNLKEDGSSTAYTETDIDLSGSNGNAKRAMQNDDDDASIQSQSQTTFPQQLMDLIESETTDDNAVTVNGQKAIEWLSEGDKFIIRDKFALESRVLPKYFNNKCKCMSFIRKLYRWGFRQVEKDFTLGMIFRHKHFTRGDKKKCLAMRSIVNAKKPPASSFATIKVSSNRRQDYSYHSGIPNPNAGDIVSSHVSQSNHHIYGDYNTIWSNLGHSGNYNILDRRVNPGLPMNYGLGLQMQLPNSNYFNNGLNWSLPTHPGSIYNRGEVTQNPFVAASMEAALHANQVHSDVANVRQPIVAIRNIGRPAEEVNLAASIMNEDPTIDAWGALQLAKRHLNGASDLRRPS